MAIENMLGHGGYPFCGRLPQEFRGWAALPERGLPAYADRYDVRYPLREWGFDREACGRSITDAGLPLPPKSACFFCPAMKQAEIDALAATEPAYHAMALEMERVFRAGKHFRGEGVYKVKAVHAQTGEQIEAEMTGPSVAEVRQQFREAQ